jgi:hypothetical protein
LGEVNETKGGKVNTSLWLIFIVFAFVLGAVCAVIWGNIQSKKGYAEAFDDGVQYENHRLYKVRLLRQTRRTARAEEVNDVTSSPEGRDGPLQGSDLSSDSEPERSESSLFSDHADASSDSTAERVGGQGVSEVDGSRNVA